MYKDPLDQYENFYNELRKKFSNYQVYWFFGMVCFVANGVWIQLTFLFAYPLILM